MKSKGNTEIPTHELESERELIALRSIDHRNPYDFTKVHRHSYFEVMLFTQGGGKNLIDFVEYEVKANAAHIISPNQIHLLRRTAAAAGHVIQFPLEAISSPKLLRLLQERAWTGNGAVLFEENAEEMARVLLLVEVMRSYAGLRHQHRMDSLQHLLQALLLDLLSIPSGPQGVPVLDPEFYQFLHLIDQQYKAQQTVSYYQERLRISEKRLAQLAQKYRGTTPLQIIHQRILLEAKRLLSTGMQPHKEIAYDLGFDSPANFSAFIKKKTGLTPSEIQQDMEEIHKQ